MAFCSTGHGQNGVLFIGKGLAYRKTEETDLCLTTYGRNRVLFIRRGVAYHKTEETDLCWSAYGRNGVLFIGRGVAYRKMGLHGLLFINHLLPRSSLHGLLFINCRLPPASTSYCSSTVYFLQPPQATVHHRVMF